ncbi:MAG: hypothetical protein N2316_04010 [Spirochaetes bacterium]|nr:hypothetical protein [Spirochaetota bacterium]
MRSVNKIRTPHHRYQRRLLVAWFFLCISCAMLHSNDKETKISGLGEGFCSNDCIQLILVAQPETTAKGLVARRDSARRYAENNFHQLLVKKIAEYRKTFSLSCMNKSDEFLLFDSKKISNYATKVAEYFKNDESLAIVVQVTKKNLKQMLECQ